jgi:hypothetical protein
MHHDTHLCHQIIQVVLYQEEEIDDVEVETINVSEYERSLSPQVLARYQKFFENFKQSSDGDRKAYRKLLSASGDYDVDSDDEKVMCSSSLLSMCLAYPCF